MSRRLVTTGGMTCLALVLGALLMSAPPAAAAAVGSLSRISGPSSCLSEKRSASCVFGRGVLNVRVVVVSPDARNVYVIGGIHASIAIFRRDTRTGALTQLAGAPGCITSVPIKGCARGRAIRGASLLALSPDGRYVYVTADGSDAVSAWRRNTKTGALTELSGKNGCVTGRASTRGCTSVRGFDFGQGLTFGDLAISPNGSNVYVTNASNPYVIVLDRAANGALSQPAGAAGCFDVTKPSAPGSCPNVSGGPNSNFTGIDSLALSADGRNVYAITSQNLEQETLLVLSRASSGSLAVGAEFSGCPAGVMPGPPCMFTGTSNLVVSHDDRNVYVGGAFSSAVARFDRSMADGTLSVPPLPAACIGDVHLGCTPANLDGTVQSLAIAPDGRNLYATGTAGLGGALAILIRDPATGALSQSRGRAACIAFARRFGCAGSGGVDSPTVVTPSPDGRSVYVFWSQNQALITYRRWH
jgi:DNA-binding beta-propeller fold protein YncE